MVLTTDVRQSDHVPHFLLHHHIFGFENNCSFQIKLCNHSNRQIVFIDIKLGPNNGFDSFHLALLQRRGLKVGLCLLLSGLGSN